jgi:hypothetical protein
MRICHQIAITLVEDTALINLDGTKRRFSWPAKPVQTPAPRTGRPTSGTALRNRRSASSGDHGGRQAHVHRLLLKKEPIAACGRLMTGTYYPTLFLAKPQDNPSIGRRLNPQDATIYTYVNAQDEYLYHSTKGGKLEERAIIRAEFCHCSQQQRLTAYASLAAEQRTQIEGQTAALGGGKFVTASGEAWYVYMCKAMVAKAREVGQCMTALPITLGANEYRT